MESEGELLEEMLETLGSEDAFKLGKIMGIMHKTDAVQIASLEHRIDALNIALGDAEAEIRRRVEQESVD